MKFLNTKILALALGASVFANAAFLTPISSGSTQVTVNGTAAIAGSNGLNIGNAANPGQLAKLTAFGFEVYDVIDAVHDFGAQLGSDTGTFTTNYIGGAGTTAPPANFSTTSASSVAGLISTSGIFSGVFGNIAWTRTYQFISADVFREVYTVQNNGTSAVANFRGFAAYDPDANNLSTGVVTVVSTNTLGTLSGFNYARAQFAGLNAVLASNNAGLSIGFLPSTNMTGNCVNALITGSSASCNTVPSSPADRAFGYAFNIASLGVGASQSFTVYQLFGNGGFNLTTALAALPGGSSSSGSGDAAPEPGSMFLMGSACVALGVIVRRRAKR